jgi:hypothetical protein
MFAEDQAINDPSGWRDTALHKHHCERIKEIVEHYGWPTSETVGEDGAMAAWLLVQHHDEIAFMKHCLPFIEKASRENQARKEDYAYLLDRVLVSEGKKQVYGSQFGLDGKGTYGPLPITDPENIEKRRAEMEMQPFAEYKTHMLARYAQRSKPQNSNERPEPDCSGQ